MGSKIWVIEFKCEIIIVTPYTYLASCLLSALSWSASSPPQEEGLVCLFSNVCLGDNCAQAPPTNGNDCRDGKNLSPMKQWWPLGLKGNM